MHSPTRFIRVTFKPEGAKRSRSVFLREPTGVEGDGPLIGGTEVNREGIEIEGRDFDERKHIIDKGLVSKIEEWRLNLHYGELEKVDHYGNRCAGHLRERR